MGGYRRFKIRLSGRILRVKQSTTIVCILHEVPLILRLAVSEVRVCFCWERLNCYICVYVYFSGIIVQ